MNQYYTEVELPELEWKIDHQSKLMMVGSCFAENIGIRMQELKFQVDMNPFGIVYNPLSVSRSLKLLMEGKQYTANDLFEHQGVWHSFDHHSRFSSTNAAEALDRMNEQLKTSAEHLKSSDYLIVSLGTSWVYEWKPTGRIVSNCHKLPAADFKRFRLTPGEIVDELKELMTALWKFNPKLKILLTVSPIRHWKDGAHGNQLSKAALLLAVDRLVTGFGTEQCAYFPSYEIMMDELRDYRFYTPDMVHISNQSIEHIWQKFGSLMFESETQQLMKRLSKLSKAVGHRPFNRNAEAYEKFLFYNLKEVEDLLKKFPFLNLSKEKEHFKRELDGYQHRGK
ncbi:GSCFA domain-containing protein [Sunxiuqinia elliptica]|uniref:GSCFA family protein n=1 Tax=Sunxiuqinia elliptica TaxID=655355 RepID=A0A1I2KH08_9BACT|nr:GSCFA domain-containing protein [Sunxiuqinia elliptica]SFF66302.1 GSCFA family protein [Sunxiuqinia elliptica]